MNRRLVILISCSLALAVIVLSMTAGVLRDNDQASYVQGAIQLASPAHSELEFYNYDKQFGTAWLLASALRLLPSVDPILVCNLVQIMLISIAVILLVSRVYCDRWIPLILLVPIGCCPALVLSLPFLGTSTMSLAFLVAAIAVLSNRPTSIEKTVVCALVATAAACRADAIMVIPALILANTSRTTVIGLFRRPFHWVLAAAAIIPVIGGQLALSHTPNTAPLFFDIRVLAGFIAFGMGAGAFLLMLIMTAGFVLLAVTKRHWFAFYSMCASSVLIPFLFYAPQLYTPRYFFPTLAVMLSWIGSRRFIKIVANIRSRPAMRDSFAFIVLLSIIPWFVGFSAPRLQNVGLTFSHATEFPSAKGYQPMGAYFEYAFAARGKGFILDHNQKTWIAAKTVNYETCAGYVPIMQTPMAAYLGLAARLQGKNFVYVYRLADSKCGFAYAEARELTRAKRSLASLSDTTPDQLPPDVLLRGIYLASTDNWAGQPILRIDEKFEVTEFGELLAALRSHFSGREIEIHVMDADETQSILRVKSEPPFDFAVFALPKGSCQYLPQNSPVSHTAIVSSESLLVATWAAVSSKYKEFAMSCSKNATIGWARTTLPPYIN